MCASKKISPGGKGGQEFQGRQAAIKFKLVSINIKQLSKIISALVPKTPEVVADGLI